MVLPGGNTCNISLSRCSPGDSMKKEGSFGLEGTLVANPLESAGRL